MLSTEFYLCLMNNDEYMSPQKVSLFLSLLFAQQNYSAVIKSETKECLLLQNSVTMWSCQVSFKGQMNPLVKRPGAAHGDILNRAAQD